MTDGPEPERGGSATAPPSGQPPAAGAETPTPAAQPPAGRAQSIDAAVKRILEFESNSVLVATIVVAVAIGIFHSNFFAWTEIKNVLQQSVYVGILAAGMAFLISMREIDLSVGSMFGLTVIGSGLLMSHGMNPWLAALAGISSERPAAC
jgi:ribose transport system permease protein